MFPNGLVGRSHRGAHICQRWELRVTERCLEEDLGRSGTSEFEDLAGIDIVKELINGRSDRTEDRNEISPLTSGVPVWVLSRGHDHRGATFYDEDMDVVWLLAYGRHRSGEAKDFFPYCIELDEEDRLLPTDADYERMFDDRVPQGDSRLGSGAVGPGRFPCGSRQHVGGHRQTPLQIPG